MSWTAPSGHVWATGEIVTAANMNTYIANDLTFLYGDTGWTAPTFTNSWANFSGFACGFRLVGTRVALKGTMQSGTWGSVAFTLPAGYRPPQTTDELVFSNGTTSAVHMGISTAGAVTPSGGSAASSCSLDGIIFDTI